jgi:4-alpha-glucanotransferase
MTNDSYPTRIITEALALLGIKRFCLSIHDLSFPATPDEDTGRGTPYGQGARRFMRFISSLGFNSLQLGPQGITPPDDPSPYMGTVFGKNPLSLAPQSLIDEYPELLSSDDWASLRDSTGPEVPQTRHLTAYQKALYLSGALIDKIYENFTAMKDRASIRDISGRFSGWVHNSRQSTGPWLERYGVYAMLSLAHQSNDWQKWPGKDTGLFNDRYLYRDAFTDKNRFSRLQALADDFALQSNRFQFIQYLLACQHARAAAFASDTGLKLYGDLQVGVSHIDFWAWGNLFLDRYRLGAPPSRTNPDGQPWGYPVLDPLQYFETDAQGKRREGRSRVFFRNRIVAMLNDFDGIRVDHPQGVVCPWVYRCDTSDHFHAVQHGARLFCSPCLPDHPFLRQFAIPTPDQVAHGNNHEIARYDDHWVSDLTDGQVDRYAALFDVVISTARQCNRDTRDILCEVLSTWPYPLKRVMQKRGIGRFCITQKCDPNKPDDLYNRANTGPEDWVMPGNHDTKPLRIAVQERWNSPWVAQKASMLADALIPDPSQRTEFIHEITRNPQSMCAALFAELFLGPAEHVNIFFSDLFGLSDVYNRPGTVSDKNWTLRVPPRFEAEYRSSLKTGYGFNIARALAMALRARSATLGGKALIIAAQLEEACLS